jgi:hypothetical protein
MADNFANYFPVSITGGNATPATGLDAVQGQTPQPLGLDLILQGIQSQYTPQTFTHSGGSYGAGRFIDGGGSVAGVGSAVGGNTAQPWFLPGEFNLPSYEATIPTEVANKVAAGEIYGGSNYSPVSSTESSSWQYDPYSSLFNPVDPITGKLIGALIPGAGLAINAAQGYQNAIGTNAMNTALAAYGSQGMGDVDPATAAFLGALGITPDSIKGAKAMAGNFSEPASMTGYFSAAVDPSVNQIVNVLMENAQTNITPEQVGVMGWSIGQDISDAVASGKSLSDAVQSVALAKGISPSEAATMGVNASVAAVTNGLQAGLSLSDIDPAAVAVYNDPMAAFIDSLGITGKINQSVANATQPITQQINSLDAKVQGYQQQGLSADQALNQALADLQSSVNNQMQGLASSDAAFQQALADMQTGVQGQINTQGQQFQSLLNQYQQVGMTQNEALSQAISDLASVVSTPVGGEVNSGTSFQPANSDGSYTSGGTSGVVVGGPIDNSMPIGTPLAPLDTGSSGGGGGGGYVGGGDGGYGSGEVGYDAGDMGWGSDTTTDSDSDSDSGNSKIVCTAMNESYGFGSFRNRIWLKYAKDNLTKAHEVGYHTIFLPLVDLAYKKNVKPLRVVLEHIARHRSADLRAEMRNSKRDNIGRAYRFILEPLCYIVGKIKGY